MTLVCAALYLAGSAHIDAQPGLPTVYIAGDSTAKNGDARGWGDPLAQFFDASKVRVENRARGGRSARTFHKEGLWEKLATDLKPADFVLIQFGHNDGGPPDKDKARGDLPGIGDESQDLTMPDGKHETVHTFGWYLRKYVNDSKRKGARPILLSPTLRNIWKDGQVEHELGSFGKWTREVAEAEHVPFVDASRVIGERYQKMGPDDVKALFPEDHTHTSAAGAELNAALIVAGLRALGDSPFDRFLSAKGLAVAAYPLSAEGRISQPANPALPTLWLIGDSTVRNGRGDGSNGQWGWGEPLVSLFDASKINVVNRALGGRSSRTYLSESRWAQVVAQLRPGDFVIMQFGHNDASPVNDNSRARGVLHGIGDESEEIDNMLTGKHEVVHSYGWYLRLFIREARAKGAIPMVCSLIPRDNWKDGHVQRSADSWAGWAKAVATEEKTPFLDLNNRIADRYDAMGQAEATLLFKTDHTHTSRAGAELNARIVVEALRVVEGNPLGAYLIRSDTIVRF